MNDEPKAASIVPGRDFPDGFARSVIAQARREQYHRRLRSRLAAAACVALVIGLIPLSHFRRPNSNTASSSAITWQDDSAEATRLAAATETTDVSDYLEPDASRVRNWSRSYAEVSWQDDSDWDSD